METIGLYIHIPFCVSKCPYCDFYSLPSPDDSLLDAYTDAVIAAMDRWAMKRPMRANTLYFGGGTPPLLGGQRLSRLIRHATERFALFEGEAPEITMEANPADDLKDVFDAFAQAGGNRVSLGMQSAHVGELRSLGRRHTPMQLEHAVAAARSAGIDYLSVDLMLGIPEQTVSSVIASVRHAARLGARHVSAYMLKLESGTPFGIQPPMLPDEDATADLYLAVIDALEREGYRQYEISNFALPGYASRHNLKYWDSRPYLGLGPAASSCLDNRRFSYHRDITAFIREDEPVTEPDGDIPTGSLLEYAMLRLRLTDGLQEEALIARFGEGIPAVWRQRASVLPTSLLCVDEQGIRLTSQGFLVSNSLICHILGG